MNIRDRRAIKYNAGRALAAAPGDPRMTVLAYAGITAVLSLLLTAVSMMLDNQIATTGGLSNMGLRSILSTAKSVLPTIQLIAALCLGLGYDSAALKISRRQHTGPRTLLDGFRRFGPLLSSQIFQALIYLAIGFVTLYAAAFLFMMTPLSSDFYEAAEPLLASATVLSSEIVIDDAMLTTLSAALMPMVPIFLLLYAAFALPVMYQYRMVNFCLADTHKPRALAALRESRAMMRQNRLQLFKLDLSFWWFYLLQGVISVVAYGDVLLPLAGVSLPWSDTVSFYLFYIVSLVIQVVVYYLFLNRIQTSYAIAYEALRPQPQESQGVPLGNIFDMR